MNDTVLNTQAETPYRMLLLLSLQNGAVCSGKRIADLDFLTLYGKSFGLTDCNLNGDNWMKFTEYAVRTPEVHSALHWLAYRGWIHPFASEDGFSYSITQEGLTVVQEFLTTYALEYLRCSRIIIDFSTQKTDRELNEWLHLMSKTITERR